MAMATLVHACMCSTCAGCNLQLQVDGVCSIQVCSPFHSSPEAPAVPFTAATAYAPTRCGVTHIAPLAACCTREGKGRFSGFPAGCSLWQFARRLWLSLRQSLRLATHWLHTGRPASQHDACGCQMTSAHGKTGIHQYPGTVLHVQVKTEPCGSCMHACMHPEVAGASLMTWLMPSMHIIHAV